MSAPSEIADDSLGQPGQRALPSDESGRDAMVRSGRPDSAAGQQSLGELVSGAVKDVSQLVRYEINLAVSEAKTDAKRILFAAGFAVVGLFVGCLLIVLLCFAYAYGLAAIGVWGGLWGAFLIVAATCFVLIALVGLIAYLLIRRVTGMKLTRKTVGDDLGMLRRGDSGPNGSGPAIANPDVSLGATAKAEIPSRP
jgi:Putative Actinobacterial Holin-X, holin superfamily III